jgi:hypothetical protein
MQGCDLSAGDGAEAGGGGSATPDGAGRTLLSGYSVGLQPASIKWNFTLSGATENFSDSPFARSCSASSL